MKRLLSTVLVLALCLAMFPVNVSAAVKINKKSITLKVGDTSTLKVIGANGTVKWTSNDEEVATVTSKGKVTAIRGGSTVITAIISNSQYKCNITVTDKKVDIIYTAAIFDDSTIDEYVKQYKEDNPDCLDVNVYDKDHIIVTMYESERKKSVNEFNDNFGKLLHEIITDDNYNGVFTDIKSDKLFKNVSIYANKDEYENAIGSYLIVVSFAMLSDGVQALNLIDVNDRKFSITIYDDSTGDILFTSNE